MTNTEFVLLLVAFASGGIWAASLAWFVWIYHERRALRIQGRIFDEAARWAREDMRSSKGQAQSLSSLLGDDDGWAVFDESWKEVRH